MSSVRYYLLLYCFFDTGVSSTVLLATFLLTVGSAFSLLMNSRTKVTHDSRTKALYLLYSLPRQEQKKEREREREGGRDRETGTGKEGERDGEKETHW